MDSIIHTMAACGITADEAASAFTKMHNLLPPTGNEERFIQNNPNLSLFQQWRLIRKLKK